MIDPDIAAELTPDERERVARLMTAKYFAFQQRYKDAPDDFTRQCFDWPAREVPHPYQLDILRQIPIVKRESVRALHGVGKSTTAAQAVIWFALTRDGWTDWKIPTTASAWRQLEKYLWPEIHKWITRLRWDRIGLERPAIAGAAAACGLLAHHSDP